MPFLLTSTKFLLLFLMIGFQEITPLQTRTEIKSAEISYRFVSKDVTGTIGGFESESIFHETDLEKSVFKGSVAVESLKTGNFLRDWSLKKGKYFNEEKYPRIRFASKEVLKVDQGFKVNGELTIKGVTKTVSIVFKRSENKLIGTSSLYSSDYGINIKSKREDNLVEVKFTFLLKL